MLRGVLHACLNALVGARCPRRRLLIVLMAATVLPLPAAPGPALAHDPSSWGGLFRSRDDGLHWFVANEGRFVTAAVAIAVDPTDPNHLLLATDSGLLTSRNGGRDWTESGAGLLRGLILAVAFAPEGSLALAASGAGLFLSDDGAETWQPTGFPVTAGLITSIQMTSSERQYVAARRGILRSDDRAATWQDAGEGLPEGQVEALIVRSDPAGPDRLYAVVNGRPFASADGATWRPVGGGLPDGGLDLVAAGRPAAELWSAGRGLIYRSEDAGLTWRPLPGRLDPPSTRVHAIHVVDGRTTLVLATDRGLYRTADGGVSWEALSGNLPTHLEAGPLVPDPADPSTLYAGFAVTPYSELRERAADGARLRLDGVNLAGAAAFLLLLFGGCGLALKRLARYYPPPERPSDGKEQTTVLDGRPSRA